MIEKIRFQPLVSLDDRQVFGYEVLYTLGEETQFPSALDIVRYLSEKGLINKDFQLHINMTVKDISSTNFALDFLDTLEKFKINPKNIVLEINEQTPPNLVIQAKQVLSHLRNKGIRIALDDFGVQYSTLSYLQDFPIDIVKIDQRFIQDAPKSKQARSILKFATGLSHDFGYKVIAEGIENNSQLECVINAGIDIGQGFLFSPARATKIKSPFANLKEFISGIISTPAHACYCI